MSHPDPTKEYHDLHIGDIIKNPCVGCGKHEANPSEYFDDNVYSYCDTLDTYINLSELNAELERLEELHNEGLTTHVITSYDKPHHKKETA